MAVSAGFSRPQDAGTVSRRPDFGHSLNVLQEKVTFDLLAAESPCDMLGLLKGIAEPGLLRGEGSSAKLTGAGRVASPIDFLLHHLDELHNKSNPG